MDTTFDKAYFEQSYGDYFARNPGRKVDAYVDIVRRHVPAGKLLEVGCAFGLYAAKMAEKGLEVTATDISSYAVDAARERFAGAGVRWLSGNLSDLDLDPGGYDAVAAFDVLEHIPELDSYLDSLADAVKPGGLLFVVVPVYDGPFGPVVRALDKDPTHIHKWPRGRWRRVFTRHGLHSIERVGLFRYGFGKHYLFSAHRVFAPASPAVFYVLRKSTVVTAPAAVA